MINHCGLLDEKSILLKRIKGQDWETLPPEARHDLDVALLTPGFTHKFWARALAVSAEYVGRWRKQIDPELRSEAIANWHSITRADCIRLSKLEGLLPLPVKIQMVSDIRNGMTHPKAEKLYGVSHHCVDCAVKAPLLSDPMLPDWFRSLIPGA